MTTQTSQPGDQSAAIPSTVRPIPAGFTSLTPFVVVDGAEQAIAFYQAVFGARVISRNDTPDGAKIAHCELELANGRLQLSDPMPDHNLVAPTGGDVVSGSVVAYLPDVDTSYAKAAELGAKGYGEPSTFVTGDRFAAILDPWGHRWALMTRVEDVDPDEAQRRIDAWLAEGGYEADQSS
jgi:uncharacterized glyoxalase superfamily protein PhnB